MMEKMIEVRADDVMAFTGSDPYTCHCRAYYGGQDSRLFLPSEDTVVRVACEEID